MEHRKDERLEVVWQGTIMLDDIDYDCQIADISTAGTMIVCDAPVEFGQEALLNIPEIGEFAAVVAWIGPGRFGLELHMGPSMLLKKYAESSGEFPSTKPAISESGDPLDHEDHEE